MEKFELAKDFVVAYVPAISFPEGIKAAFETLESLIPPEKDRTVFGLSWPDKNGKIMYKAAVEEKYIGEGKNYGLGSFVIKKGSYISELIKSYSKDVSQIGETFQHLLKHPDVDPKGYCLEWYKGIDDVLCLVKLN